VDRPEPTFRALERVAERQNQTVACLVGQMHVQVSTLFVSDPDGRLRYHREPGYCESDLEPAPRFFLGRTSQGHVWRFRHDLPQALVHELERLCQAEPVTTDLADEPHNTALIRAALHAHAPISGEERGPAYLIPNGVKAAGEAVLISAANAHLLERHFPWKRESAYSLESGPITGVVEEGSAVSICHCARLSPLAAEAGVETVAPFRGRGYAGAAVASWAGAVRDLGLIPLYSTQWENCASRAVARKLGMVCYGEDWWIT